MSGQPTRPHRGRGAGLLTALAACLIMIAPAAAADPPPAAPATTDDSPSTTATTAPDSSVPTSPAPTSTVPPTTRPAGPATTSRRTTSTSGPELTTTTVLTDPGADQAGFVTSAAPLIPTATSDPLFHAALTVDDDLRTVALGKLKVLKRASEARTAGAAASAAQGVFETAHSVDVAARARLRAAQVELRATALHAYTGFGSQETALNTPEVEHATTALPYRTYVEVTVAEAKHRSEAALQAQRRTAATATAAAARNDRAQSAARAARTAKRQAAAGLADASKRLLLDRKALDDLIASLPDLAPGTLEKLPKVAKLPPGAQKVASPAGDIIVPAKADPRTAVALQFIVAQLGKPYVWGATGPGSYDCSGLMLRSFQAAGVTSMPRVSQAQQVWATPVDVKDVQPGDLVFFGRPAYHVGVYIGGGLMMDAPFTGAYVRVDKVWSSVTSYGRPVWSTPSP